MQNHLHFDSLDSTMFRLKHLVETSDNQLDAFFAITAAEQTSGRGRQSKSWESQCGKNLLMSVLLYPEYPPQKQFYVCRYVSLALVEFLTKRIQIENVHIKYPNDIYVGDKKIAGILIEHSLQGDKINYSIAGIGLNVNQAVFPAHLPNPTSIFLEANKEFPPFFCMEELIKSMQILSKFPPALLEQQYEQFLYKKNEYATFLMPEKSEFPIVAKIKGVTENGLLHLFDKDNQPLFCALNEIVYL
ncbi:MAG: biotin--[acetyl-CoA-carboxylase] ligase [Lentimicrobiaceae bacterium]|nr:biotin--[acetyl-CoA-carboxylase] ligase [Lentimicrobiaceae bacterium]